MSIRPSRPRGATEVIRNAFLIGTLEQAIAGLRQFGDAHAHQHLNRLHHPGNQLKHHQNQITKIKHYASLFGFGRQRP